MGIYELPQQCMYWTPSFRLSQVIEALKGGVNRYTRCGGYKVFTRCGETGMLYNFEIYCGRNANASLPSHLGVTGDLVMRICQNLPHQQQYKVFFDNYFTSIPLLLEFRENGILALSTIRQNKMIGAQKLFQSDKELKKKGRGSSDWRVDVWSNVVVVKCMDNSAVHLAFTFVDNSLGEQIRRWSAKESSYIKIDSPKMVHKNNNFMEGVDLNNMLFSMYRIKVRSKNWYIPIFLFNKSCFDKWMASLPTTPQTAIPSP